VSYRASQLYCDTRQGTRIDAGCATPDRMQRGNVRETDDLARAPCQAQCNAFTESSQLMPCIGMFSSCFYSTASKESIEVLNVCYTGLRPIMSRRRGHVD